MIENHVESKLAEDPFRPRRARSRVMRFLEQHCLAGQVGVGERLPSSRVIADRVGVSLTTVQHVFRDLAEEGVVRVEVGSGSFLVKPLPGLKPRTLRIGLTFGVQERGEQTGPWSRAISAAVMDAAAHTENPPAIHPVRVPNQPVEEVVSCLQAQEGRVDALILHPVHEGDVLMKRLESLQYPVVHLNPLHATALTNFVSADYFEVSRRLGEVWAAGKKRRVLFVHNSGVSMNASASLRCFGLVAGLGNRVGTSVQLRILSVDLECDEEDARVVRESVNEFSPDAIYAVGDQLGVMFWQECVRRGLAVPGEVSVVSGGGTAQLRPPFAEMTRAHQPEEEIGRALLEMACALTRPGVRELPGRIFPCQFRGGGTTTDAENQKLGVS